MAVLELKEVKKVYQKGEQEVHALRGVDLNIEKGEFLSIVGPSGSGKSTLLNITGCLDTPTSGKVIYNGKELGRMKEKGLSDYRKDNIAFIFQSYNLIPVLTVQENVELPLVIEKQHSKKDMAKMAMKIIELVGLKGMENRLPKEISGGQEQRVAIARALVKKPLVVLADEPTANLDSTLSEEIITIMQKMNNENDTTFIFSTHDALVEKHAKRVIILKDGNIDSDVRR
jgi:putative ABC transport system ATP-binding protein